MKYVQIRFIVFAVIWVLGSCSGPDKIGPETVDGFLDLSSWNFGEDGIVDLNGKWEFYWERLLAWEDFKDSNTIEHDLISVPGGWTSERSEGDPYPEFGYATYRLKVRVPDRYVDYSLIFSSVFTSVRVTVNGSLCFENGKVGRSEEEAEPQFTTNFYSPISYRHDRDTLEIIVQVSDFNYGGPAAGIRRNISFGPDDLINEERIKSYSVHALLIGILLLIALYHFFLFGYRTNDRSYLVFAILSLVVVTWTIYSSGMFVNLFSYNGYLGFGHFAPATFPPLLVLFYYYIYRDEVHKIVLYAFLVTALLFLLIIFITTANTLAQFFTIFSMNMMVPLAYLLGYSLLKAVIKGRPGAILTYLSVLIMAVSVLHDALFSNNYIQGFGTYVASYGFVALIIIQSLVLAQMFSLTFRKNINLNLNLEKLVKERTRTIEEQRSILEMQNLDLIKQKEEIEAQNDVLNQRNEEIEVQRDYAHKQNEEIRDSLNYAQRIQAAMLPPETYFSELLHENFILYRPRDIVSGDFYWIKQVNRYVVLVAADCTGHGVPGAFMSLLGISYLTEIVQRREITQADQILNELRKQIISSLRQHGERDEAKDGIDMALCVLDLKKYTMQFAGANNPLYLIRGVEKEAQLTEFKADQMHLGYYYGKYRPFTNHDINLEQGDTIYIFSDGFIDQKGGRDDKRFMSKRFKNLLLEIQDQPMLDQKEILVRRLSGWMRNNSQTDDILVIGVRV